MMSRREIEACKILLNDDSDEEDSLETDSDNSDVNFDFEKAVAAGEKRKEREVAGKSKHVDCSFIMGTAACVERLWSEADEVVTKRRKAMNPVTLEMILFLKKNKDLWNIEDVVEADKRRKTLNKESRAQKKIDESAALDVLINSINALSV